MSRPAHPPLPLRVFERSVLWSLTLRSLSGSSFHVSVGLAMSAALDVARFALTPDQAISPTVYVSGIVRGRTMDARFYVRAGSDDLYNVCPGREGRLEDLIFSTLRKGDTLLDVGANIGYYAVRGAQRTGPRGCVLAFEPVPETRTVLRRNLELNRLTNATVFDCACWNTRGEIPVWVPSRYFGFASPVNQRGSRLMVRAAPLDELAIDVQEVRVLKIDVEGAELQVLRGAVKVLERTRLLVIEISRDFEAIDLLARSHGFQLRRIANSANYAAFRGASE